MKNASVLWWTIGIILAGFIVGGWFFKSDKGQVQAPTQTNASTTTAIVTSIRSDVFAIKDGSSETLVSESTTLVGNDSVKTGVQGRALIENDDFKAVVDHDSQIALSDLVVKNSKLNLNSGSVWLRVEKVFGVGEGLEVDTPNAVATVRGTSFGLTYLNQITTLIVTEGIVGFRGINSSDEILVHPGEKVTIGSDGNVKVSPLTDADKNAEWYQYNNPSSITTTAPVVSNPKPIPPLPTSTSTNIVTPPPANTSPPVIITLTKVDPPSISQGQTTNILIYGSGLNSVTVLNIGGINFPFTLISDSEIITNLSQLNPGVYNITVSGQGKSSTLSGAITITASNPNYVR